MATCNVKAFMLVPPRHKGKRIFGRNGSPIPQEKRGRTSWSHPIFFFQKNLGQTLKSCKAWPMNTSWWFQPN